MGAKVINYYVCGGGGEPGYEAIEYSQESSRHLAAWLAARSSPALSSPAEPPPSPAPSDSCASPELAGGEEAEPWHKGQLGTQKTCHN